MASTLEREGRGLLRPPLLVWPLNIYSLTAQLLVLRNPTPLKAEGLVGHYYDGLLDFLGRSPEEGGLGRELWVFTYDWRQSCHYAGGALTEFITQKLLEANTRRAAQNLPPWEGVDLISHSMGGFVVRSAQREFAAPIRRAVYIASGHYGFTKAYFALHPDTATKLLDDFIKDFIPGWYWDLVKTLPNVWFLQGWLAKLLRTFPAMYELLPDQFYLEEPPGLVLDATQTPPMPITGLEETYYRHGWRLPPVLHARIAEGMRFKERLGRDLPGEANLVIYAAAEPTYARVTYSGYLHSPERLLLGDGTVTASSANRAQNATQVVVEATHTQIPNLPATHEAIRSFFFPPEA